MNQLKNKLNYYYKHFNENTISPDPLEFLHNYKDPRDIEAIGFIASVFAYGNINQILRTVSSIEKITEHSPYNFICNYDQKKDKKIFSSIVHRFYSSEDVSILFYILNRVYTEYESIKNLFLLYYFEEDNNLKHSIHFFSNNLFDIGVKLNNSRGLKFMFPDPYKGSPCKRMNLFLRWMVRKDDLDFGLWYEIPKNKLVIPIDTHVEKICKKLNLTKRKNISWLMAEEITNNLRKYDPVDPVKYDFAICHIGMRKIKF